MSSQPWSSGPSQAPLPPLVQGLPILGSALELKRDPLQFLIDKYHEYGPIFRVQAAGRSFTVMAGPAANLFATREGDSHWHGKDFWAPFADEINSKHFLAAIDGEPHSRLRKIIKKPYSREFVLDQLPALVEITRQALTGWQPGKVVTVHPFIQRLVAEQIGHLVLGAGPGDYLGDFVIFMQTLLNTVQGLWPRWMLRSPKYLRAKARLMKLARNLLDRGEIHNLDENQADLIDYLLSAQKDNQDILAEPEMLIGAIGPYLAGIDTSAGTISFMLYALLKNPQFLPEIRAELETGFKDGPLTGQKLRSMPALHAATQETLRRYPVAPALQRTVTQPFEFNGYRVDPDTVIMAATAVAHFDSNLYPHPEVFDPARCREPRREQKQPGAFSPFGAGAHTCAGAGFAEVQIAASIATLLHDFELELADPEYKLKITFNPAPAPDADFRVRVKSRK